MREYRRVGNLRENRMTTTKTTKTRKDVKRAGAEKASEDKSLDKAETEDVMGGDEDRGALMMQGSLRPRYCRNAPRLRQMARFLPSSMHCFARTVDIRRRSGDAQEEWKMDVCLSDEALNFAADPTLNRVLICTGR